MIASAVLAVTIAVTPGSAAEPPAPGPPGSPVGASLDLALTLDDAIQRALEHSPLLAAARAGDDASAARVDVAWRSFLPRVDLEQTVSRSNNPVYVFGSLLTQGEFGEANFAVDSLNRPDALTNHQTRLVLEQALYDGGRRFLALRDAHLGRDVSREDWREAEMGVVFATIQTYFGIDVQQARVGVLTSALAAAAADLDRATARAAAGLATEADVLALRVQHADLEVQRIRARNEVDLSHAELARLVGLPLDRRFIPLTGIEAGRDRPGLGDDSGANWMIAVSVRLRLFDGLERLARLDEAAAGERQAAAARVNALEVARLEVRRAVLNLRAVRAQVEVASSAIQHARESHRIVSHRYDAGLAGVTDLLGAHNALVAVETRRLAALYEERLAAVGVEFALGTLAVPARNDEEKR